MDLEPPTAPALLELLAAEPIREPRESWRVDPTPARSSGATRRHGSTSSIVRTPGPSCSRATDGRTTRPTRTATPTGRGPRRKPARARRRPCTPIRLPARVHHVDPLAASGYDGRSLRVHGASRYGGDFKAAAHALKPSSNGKLRGIVHDVAGLVASTVGAATHAVVTKLRPDEGELEAVNLPDEFWNARRELAHIRQAAQSRRRSPDAVLHVVLSRVAGFTSHTLKLPPLVGSRANLCHFAAVCGPPGSGKSSANAVGRGSCRCQPTSLPASSTSCRSALAKD